MRPYFLIAALVVASPVLAQTNVSAGMVRRAAPDSVRLLIERRVHLSPVEVRKLSVEVQALAELLKVAEREWTRTAAAYGSAAVDTMRRKMLDFAQKQSQIAMACAELRASPPGYLGVAFLDTATVRIRAGIEPEIERFNRVPVIGDVSQGSPAEKSGVRRGDAWIAVNGRQIVGMQVDSVFAMLKPGARLDLRFRRDGRDLELPTLVEKQYPDEVCDRYLQNSGVFTFTIEGPEQRVVTMRPSSVGASAGSMRGEPQPARAAPGGFAAGAFMTNSPLNGATFRMLTTEKREVLKAPADAAVLVDAVDPQSRAGTAGLREWDVVLRVNGDRVATIADLFRALNIKQALVLTVFKGGETRTITIER